MDSITVTLSPDQENAIVDALARRYPGGSPVAVSTLQILADAHAPRAGGTMTVTEALAAVDKTPATEGRARLRALLNLADAVRAGLVSGTKPVSAALTPREPAPQAAGDTMTRDLPAILADLADFTVARTRTRAIGLYHELEDALRARLTAASISDTGQMAAETAHAARTMAPPVPGVTANAGFTVRAVLPGRPAGGGLLESWWVAAEDASRGVWVTWEAYALDGADAGKLAYSAGHYFPDMFTGPGQDDRQAALRDLAVRAGIVRHPGNGVLLTSEQLREWSGLGRDLTDDELARLDECIPNSSIPDAIETIVTEAMGLLADDEETL